MAEIEKQIEKVNTQLDKLHVSLKIWLFSWATICVLDAVWLHETYHKVSSNFEVSLFDDSILKKDSAEQIPHNLSSFKMHVYLILVYNSNFIAIKLYMLHAWVFQSQT